MLSNKYDKKLFRIGTINNILSLETILFWVFICLVTLFLSCKKTITVLDNSVHYGVAQVADNFVAPLLVVEPPDNSKRLFILDQEGTIWVITKDGVKLTTPFIDIKSKMVGLKTEYDERGLLGLAFHPDYKNNGKFYLFYTAPPRSGGPDSLHKWDNLTRISEFRANGADPNIADMGSERIILEADHPQLNHDGGTIAFGPDGYLYISIGDGGGKDDVGPGHLEDWYGLNKGGNAQNLYGNLMGKILRIDVNSGNPYSIPADNPYAGTTARPEIYAFGFRNPYRFSFDMAGTHQLIAGDAGQSLYEEINIVLPNYNYGWNVREGTVCFSTDSDLLTRPSCPTLDIEGRPLRDPVIQLKNYANPDGGGIATAIVGGYVYRGTAIKSLEGFYVFGVFSKDGKPNGKLYYAFEGLKGGYDELPFSSELGQYLKGFGQDLSGEIYLTTSMQVGLSGTTGKVYKVVQTSK